MRTERTKLRRKPARGSHDLGVVEAILDEAVVSHVGLVDPHGWPVVTPTLHVRVGEKVYIHGSAASRTLRIAGQGHAEGGAAPGSLCLTASILDGLVLARSAMHHSANYRSAMVFGLGREVSDGEEKMAVLEALVEKLVRGRWADARRPTNREMRATSVIAIPLTEASAKVRTGPPADDAADESLPIWAGVVPLAREWVAPEPDERCAGAGIPVPEYLDAMASAAV